MQQKGIAPLVGLYYIQNVLPLQELEEIMVHLQREDRWFAVGSGKNSRRVMHYGYKYNYGGGATQTQPAPEFPEIIARLRNKLIDQLRALPEEVIRDLVNEKLDQCIVNRYQIGQGIGAHIDSPAYGRIIGCYTFGGGATMEFTGAKEYNQYSKVEHYTEPNSLYIMTGAARHDWKHEMVGRKSDTVVSPGGNKKVNRTERISVTFRSVVK